MFVASVILAIVLQDGHRGVPSGENCLLLLNVVASSPLSFANPEQLNPFFFANVSIACQSVVCVKSFSFVVNNPLFFCLWVNYFINQTNNQV